VVAVVVAGELPARAVSMMCRLPHFEHLSRWSQSTTSRSASAAVLLERAHYSSSANRLSTGPERDRSANTTAWS
jgi:hypothetical protein